MGLKLGAVAVVEVVGAVVAAAEGVVPAVGARVLAVRDALRKHPPQWAGIKAQLTRPHTGRRAWRPLRYGDYRVTEDGRCTKIILTEVCVLDWSMTISSTSLRKALQENVDISTYKWGAHCLWSSENLLPFIALLIWYMKCYSRMDYSLNGERFLQEKRDKGWYGPWYKS